MSSPSVFRIGRWQSLRRALGHALEETAAVVRIGVRQLLSRHRRGKLHPWNLALPRGRRRYAPATARRHARGEPDVVRSPWRSGIIPDLLGWMARAVRDGAAELVGSARGWAQLLGCCERSVRNALKELLEAAEGGEVWLTVRGRFRPDPERPGRFLQVANALVPGPLLLARAGTRETAETVSHRRRLLVSRPEESLTAAQPTVEGVPPLAGQSPRAVPARSPAHPGALRAPSGRAATASTSPSGLPGRSQPAPSPASPPARAAALPGPRQGTAGGFGGTVARPTDGRIPWDEAAAMLRAGGWS
jgi:hypothetical protein